MICMNKRMCIIKNRKSLVAINSNKSISRSRRIYINQLNINKWNMVKLSIKRMMRGKMKLKVNKYIKNKKENIIPNKNNINNNEFMIKLELIDFLLIFI